MLRFPTFFLSSPERERDREENTHNDNLPMQYTEMFSIVKIEKKKKQTNKL